MLNNKYFYLVTVTGLVLLLDQLTKIWIRISVPLRKTIEVIPGFFRVVHVENEGAAWGIMADSAYRIPFFIVATLVAFGVIAVYFSRIPKGLNGLAIAISLILGGAIGNFIDRLVYQSVTDFIDFYIGFEPVSSWLIRNFRSNRWPSFNIADVAIVAGLILIMYDMFVLEPRRMKAEEAAAINGDEGLSGASTGEGGSR